MPRGPQILSRVAGPAILLGLTALMPLLVTGEEAEAGVLRLLLLFLALPVLAVLALEAPLWRRPSLLPRLLLLALAMAAAVLVAARRSGLDSGELAVWSAGPVILALAGLGAAGLAGGRRFAALAGLAAPATAIFLPFLADSWIARTSDPVRLRAGLEVLLRLSPWPGAVGDLFGIDIFKNEGLYREFRVGEQLYALPGAAAALQAQVLLAIGLLATGFALRVLRGLLARILSPSPGCASISQP